MDKEVTAHSTETLDAHSSIADLLPRYCEAHNGNTTFTIDRLMTIDGHDVAWLSYETTLDYQDGTEPEVVKGHEVQCACYFAENVGWRTDEKYGTIGLSTGTECPIKKQAVALRHAEINAEYSEMGVLERLQTDKTETIKMVIFDVLERCKNGEVLEVNNGSRVWGGYFYLQSIEEILGLEWQDIWQAVNELCADKVIKLNGMVVQEYKEPQQKETYDFDAKNAQVTFYNEKPEKIWALVPKPEHPDVDVSNVGNDTLPVHFAIGQCMMGLAHTKELANTRLQEAMEHPRISHERLYQQSFVEPQYHKGPLTVIAYTASNDYQPNEWLIEAFLGDAITPEVKTLQMYYPTIFGIDYSDQDALNQLIDEWFPANK